MKATGIALDTRLKERFEYGKKILDNSVCPECEEKYLREGVLLIDFSNGSLVVMKDEAFLRLTDNKMKIPPNRIIETPYHIIKCIQDAIQNV